MNIVVALAAAAAASITPAAEAATAPPRARLSPVKCVKALDPTSRSVDVTATMRPLTGTQQLAMSFQLLARPAGTSAWTAITGPGLGTWVSPTDPPTLGRRPGDVWRVSHPVADLAGPVAYRFTVVFRWLGSGGKILGQQTLTSGVCQQQELRPDLVVGSVTMRPSPAGGNRRVYAATISNTGLTAASAVPVQLSVGGAVVLRTIKRIGAHRSVVVKFTAPACNAATPATVTVDPADRIDVASRAGAVANVSCTLPSGFPSGIRAHRRPARRAFGLPLSFVSL